MEKYFVKSVGTLLNIEKFGWTTGHSSTDLTRRFSLVTSTSETQPLTSSIGSYVYFIIASIRSLSRGQHTPGFQMKGLVQKIS